MIVVVHRFIMISLEDLIFYFWLLIRLPFYMLLTEGFVLSDRVCTIQDRCLE